jgi:hypothetical protein
LVVTIPSPLRVPLSNVTSRVSFLAAAVFTGWTVAGWNVSAQSPPVSSQEPAPVPNASAQSPSAYPQNPAPVPNTLPQSPSAYPQDPASVANASAQSPPAPPQDSASATAPVETAPVETSPVVLAPVVPAPVAVPLNDQRIALVIPDYQTVEDSSVPVAPMTAREKWYLGWKETIDPFNIATAAMTAAWAQRGNQTPKYGEGWPNYGRRFGAAIGDFGTQNLFSAGLFAVLTHQDPRYFRKGPSAKIPTRIWYSISRIAICRNDAGHDTLNTSNFLGMGLGIAASNIYYPSSSRTGTVMAGRVETSMLGGVTGNLMSEFWPDIQKKFFRKKPK